LPIEGILAGTLRMGEFSREQVSDLAPLELGERQVRVAGGGKRDVPVGHARILQATARMF